MFFFLFSGSSSESDMAVIQKKGGAPKDHRGSPPNPGVTVHNWWYTYFG